jgi:hypothetical protein
LEVSFHRLKNVGLVLKSTEVHIREGKQEPKKAKVEQVIAAGVANSAICTSLVEHAKNILIPEENKSATKGDIAKILRNL